jgi:hypothetical protein
LDHHDDREIKQPKEFFMPKRFWLFWLAAFLVALAFDFLFWNKAPGISILIWVTLILGTGIAVIYSEGVKPSLRNIILVVAAIGMAFVTAFRSEPFTRFVALALCFIALFILAYSYRNGYWIWFRLQDHLTALFRLIGAMFSRGFGSDRNPKTPPALPTEDRHKGRRITFAVLRGLLISIPIIAVLAALLASADPVFSSWLAKAFNVTRLPEYIFRLIYILFIAFIVTSAFFHAAFPRKEEQIPSDDQKIIKPFLGWIESVVILGLVNILFLTFVILQFRYLFGAQSNIVAEGYTYAEYARRGFFELVTVAVLSLGLYLALGTVAKREKPAQIRTFSGLALGLIALVLVILASSLQRLLLYEQAYGFSRVRTYTHIFIFWLAGLLLVTAVLEILSKQRLFALGLLVAVFGFGITLAAMNIDGFIVNQNIARVTAGEKFDAEYISTLSDDAVPFIVRAFHSQDPKVMTKAIHDQLGAGLACRLFTLQDAKKAPWQSFNFGELIAQNQLQTISAELKSYPTSQKDGMLFVKINGIEQNCSFTGD